MCRRSMWRGGVTRRRPCRAIYGGRPPRNKGVQYPADPATVDEIVSVMRHTRDNHHGFRLRAIIVVLWRAGLRVQEALALTEHDLDARRASLRVRRGKGGRRREVGMDEWGWQELDPWLTARAKLPAGPLFASSTAPLAAGLGRVPRSAGEFRLVAAKAGVRRRFAPHQLRHAHALELEGVPLNIILRQLGHTPRHHLHLSAGDRPRRDPLRGPRAARADDVGERRTASVTRDLERERFDAPALPHASRRPRKRPSCSPPSSIPVV
jgi:integrase